LFKDIHPSFWWGIAIFYGYCMVFMIIEMSVPGFIYHTKIGAAPAAYIYSLTVGLYIIPLIVSFMWFYLPEQDQKRRAAQKSGKGVDQ